MGMTDRQYDDHQKSLLRELKRIRKTIAKHTDEKIEELEELIEDIEDHLKRL